MKNLKLIQIQTIAFKAYFLAYEILVVIYR